MLFVGYLTAHHQPQMQASNLILQRAKGVSEGDLPVSVGAVLGTQVFWLKILGSFFWHL